MKTYRYSGHSRSDAATYRPPGELDAWKKRDPIDIYGARLIKDGTASEDELARLRAGTKTRVEQAAEKALASPEPGVDEMFRHVFAGSASTVSGGRG